MQVLSLTQAQIESEKAEVKSASEAETKRASEDKNKTKLHSVVTEYEIPSMCRAYLAEFHKKIKGKKEFSELDNILTTLLSVPKVMLSEIKYKIQLLSLSKHDTKEGQFSFILEGYFNEKGLGCEKNPKEAVEIYEHEHVKNLPEAQNRLGNCLLLGTGKEKDPSKAAALFRQASEKGDAAAYYNLYIVCGYHSPEGYKKEDSIAYLRKSSGLGYAVAQYELVVCLEREKEVKYLKEIFSLLEQAAASGYPEALCKLGTYYRDGIYTEKDIKKSLDYILMAGKNGDRRADDELVNLTRLEEDRVQVYFYLAQYYEEGIILSKDIKQSIDNYQFALYYLHKIEDSCLKHALAYRAGRLYVQENVEDPNLEAIRAFSKCDGADAPTTDILNLARCFEQGKYVVKNEAIARELYESAAARGCQYSKIWLAKKEYDKIVALKKANKMNEKAMKTALFHFYLVANDPVCGELFREDIKEIRETLGLKEDPKMS